MMVRVYKKTKNKDENTFYDWQSNSKFVYSLEVSDIGKALELLNSQNDKLENISVSDGDFLVDEGGVPHMVSENCTKVRRLGGKMCKVHRYGQS